MEMIYRKGAFSKWNKPGAVFSHLPMLVDAVISHSLSPH